MKTASKSSISVNEAERERGVETAIQGLRALKLAQVRRQLEDDFAAEPARFNALLAFIIDALEQ
jgi:hypothetical protein